MAENVIKSAGRLLEILEYFDETRRPASLRDISARFDYPASSASALLKSMVVMGYLDYDGYSRTYMPTMKVASLGSWVGQALFGEGQVLRLMDRLAEVSGETIAIATQSDLVAQFIHILPSEQPLRYHIKSGVLRPLARSGMGWLLLSARSDEAIERTLQRINAQEPDAALHVELADLMGHIREIRKQGFVHTRHMITPGTGMIAMLLPDRSHGRIQAICVGGPVDRLDEARDVILEEMRSGIAALED